MWSGEPNPLSTDASLMWRTHCSQDESLDLCSCPAVCPAHFMSHWVCRKERLIFMSEVLTLEER